MSIEATNIKIAHRIMRQTGFIDHTKDIEHFNKSRLIANRLQKFKFIDRMMSPKRNNSIPSRLPRLKT